MLQKKNGPILENVKKEEHFKVEGLNWVVPPPSNSHHQDYYIFSRGSQPKPSFATVTGRGDNPRFEGPLIFWDFTWACSTVSWSAFFPSGLASRAAWAPEKSDRPGSEIGGGTILPLADFPASLFWGGDQSNTLGDVFFSPPFFLVGMKNSKKFRSTHSFRQFGSLSIGFFTTVHPKGLERPIVCGHFLTFWGGGWKCQEKGKPPTSGRGDPWSVSWGLLGFGSIRMNQILKGETWKKAWVWTCFSCGNAEFGRLKHHDGLEFIGFCDFFFVTFPQKLRKNAWELFFSSTFCGDFEPCQSGQPVCDGREWRRGGSWGAGSWQALVAMDWSWVVVSFIFFLIFTPKIGEDEPNLTWWVGEPTTN